MTTGRRSGLGLGLVLVLLVGACSDGSDAATMACDAPSAHAPVTADQVAAADVAGTTVTLVAPDSFAVSDGVLDAFTAETGIDVQVVSGGGAEAMVDDAVRRAGPPGSGQPAADVMFGIDSILLCRGLESDIFLPYTSPALDHVHPSLQLDGQHRVTPVDYDDVCLNFDTSRYSPADPDAPPPPATLDDLLRPEYQSQLVVEYPETSTPGLAFLLASIGRYGDDWDRWWTQLSHNGVRVTSTWEQAYHGEFSGASDGERPIVVSYATSPVAEVVDPDTPADQQPTAAVLDACYRLVEFAGILDGTDAPEASALLVDFLLSDTFQDDVPTSMLAFPASTQATLPDVFARYAAVPHDVLMLDPAEVEARRDGWIDRWELIMLRSDIERE